jgi:hypothetical protein
LGALYYFYGGHSVPKGQPPLVSFSPGDLTPLKTAFNASASSIGVVVMLSPVSRLLAGGLCNGTIAARNQ